MMILPGLYMNSPIRVRFAPSPTGMMHLGGVRTALMNYLFAKQKNGSFILRIEDTDAERNFDPMATKIIEDITWLGLSYNEGPLVGGPHEPYFQSLRDSLYKERLAELHNMAKAYRCFCTLEELEKKRARQIALKTPPRYDRACLLLSEQEINHNLEQKKPFIWRLKLDKEGSITIQDMAHGPITFDLKNFSDFPLTREDGTATFMFANFVDDMMMRISHVIRGEDHLTNTAGQAMLYKAFDYPLPLFWHVPILCSIDGKKLSKRDFGFSLRDLKDAGFLPEAICNYLAIIGASFAQEFMSLDQLAAACNFDHLHSTGQIKYDVEKLRWFNHKWINHIATSDLATRCLPFLLNAYPQAKIIPQSTLERLIAAIKTDLHTLADSVVALEFYFKEPLVTHKDITPHIQNAEQAFMIGNIVAAEIKLITDPQSFINAVKTAAKNHNVPIKDLFTFIRVALTGQPKGLGAQELIELLGTDVVMLRLMNVTG